VGRFWPYGELSLTVNRISSSEADFRPQDSLASQGVYSALDDAHPPSLYRGGRGSCRRRQKGWAARSEALARLVGHTAPFGPEAPHHPIRPRKVVRHRYAVEDRTGAQARQRLLVHRGRGWPTFRA
jgi:hypothetical protein